MGLLSYGVENIGNTGGFAAIKSGKDVFIVGGPRAKYQLGIGSILASRRTCRTP